MRLFLGASEDEEPIARMFVVGGLAGMLETFIVQPLVYWKTISQVSTEPFFTANNLRPSVMYR